MDDKDHFWKMLKDPDYVVMHPVYKKIHEQKQNGRRAWKKIKNKPNKPIKR